MNKIELDLKARAESLDIPLDLIRRNAELMSIPVDRYLNMLERVIKPHDNKGEMDYV